MTYINHNTHRHVNTQIAHARFILLGWKYVPVKFFKNSLPLEVHVPAIL